MATRLPVLGPACSAFSRSSSDLSVGSFARFCFFFFFFCFSQLRIPPGALTVALTPPRQPASERADWSQNFRFHSPDADCTHHADCSHSPVELRGQSHQRLAPKRAHLAIGVKFI